MDFTDWTCPECATINRGAMAICYCGYELPIEDDPDAEVAVQYGDSNAQDSPKPDPQKILSLIQNRDYNNSRAKNLTILIVCILVFFVAGLIKLSAGVILSIIISILIHESGHLIAMKYSGYRNLNMLIIPFVGGAAAGETEDNDASTEAMIALAGPAAGIASAIISGFIYKFTGVEVLKTYTEITVLLSFFNLLPIYPLDGGRLWESILFSRHQILEIGFRAVAALVLLIVGLKTPDVLLAIIGIFLLISLKTHITILGITKRFRGKFEPSSKADILNVEFLVKELASRLPKLLHSKDVNKVMAAFIRTILLRSIVVHAQAKYVFLFVILYLASLALALLALSSVV